MKRRSRRFASPRWTTKSPSEAHRSAPRIPSCAALLCRGTSMIDHGITELRLRLRESGYDAIPCEGKRPPMTAWNEKIGATPDEIGMWEKAWQYADNTGLFCKRTPAIDIDIMNPDAANAVEALAREHFEERGNILV